MYEANQIESLHSLVSIVNLLACPTCRGPLEITKNHIFCKKCGSTYEIWDGLALLTTSETTAKWMQNGKDVTKSSYQANYQEVSRAAIYNEKYKKKILKRASTQRESKLIQHLLKSQKHSSVLLDLPCGGGRLSPQLAPFTDILVEADIGLGQLMYGREHSSLPIPQLWLKASAFQIPFQDASVDGVFCCRLSHHLPDENGRKRLVQELLRVAKSFVIMTFFDYYSVKNLLRRARRPLNNKPPKMTMTVRQIAELAQENEFKLLACPALSTLFSGHRYALMVRRNQ